MTTMQYRINSSSCASELSMYSERKIVDLFFEDAASLSDPNLLGKKASGLVEEVSEDFYTRLSERDQELFLKTLANPPPLNDAFIKAYRKFHNSKKKQ